MKGIKTIGLGQLAAAALATAGTAHADVSNQQSYQIGQQWSPMAARVMQKLNQAGYDYDKGDACVMVMTKIVDNDTTGKGVRLADQGFDIDIALDACRDNI
jgi:hypothetical protein